MSSRGSATVPRGSKKPPKNKLPASDVQTFRRLLDALLNEADGEGRKWGDARWGVYAFYDYDGEPIYVGQTNERLRTRVRRHLTNQRTDVVAMRILDPFEVAEVEVWPLWDFQGVTKDSGGYAQAKQALDAAEYAAYVSAIENSRFKAILNEKIPPTSPVVALPDALRKAVISPEIREERGHPDIRIARRAETISRLAAVARERGEVTDGLRRVLVIQALRLAYIAAVRLAHVEGRSEPDAEALNADELVWGLTHQVSDDNKA